MMHTTTICGKRAGFPFFILKNTKVVIFPEAHPCEMDFGIPRNFFQGIPRNKGVNFHGKFGLGIE